MAYFNEQNTVEQMLINAAARVGWIYVEPDQIPRISDDVLVGEWLMTALVKINKITNEQAQIVIDRLRSVIISCNSFDNLVAANDQFRKLLFEENSYPFGPDGDNINIRFFSDDMSKNRCVVTNQWEFPRPSHEGGKRLDLVYLINGIPMVIGEAKTPVRPDVTWADGATTSFTTSEASPRCSSRTF